MTASVLPMLTVRGECDNLKLCTKATTWEFSGQVTCSGHVYDAKGVVLLRFGASDLGARLHPIG